MVTGKGGKMAETKSAVMRQRLTLTGNEAVSWAMKLARTQAGLFFPIGPADQVMETFRIRIDRGDARDAKLFQIINTTDLICFPLGHF